MQVLLFKTGLPVRDSVGTCDLVVVAVLSQMVTTGPGSSRSPVPTPAAIPSPRGFCGTGARSARTLLCHLRGPRAGARRQQQHPGADPRPGVLVGTPICGTVTPGLPHVPALSASRGSVATPPPAPAPTGSGAHGEGVGS